MVVVGVSSSRGHQEIDRKRWSAFVVISWGPTAFSRFWYTAGGLKVDEYGTPAYNLAKIVSAPRESHSPNLLFPTDKNNSPCTQDFDCSGYFNHQSSSHLIAYVVCSLRF